MTLTCWESLGVRPSGSWIYLVSGSFLGFCYA
ncbi:MAG: hypothetical protein ABR568_21000, partial [Pyrinomonadaceae bacterium]